MNPDPRHRPQPSSADVGPLLLLSGSGLPPWIWDQFLTELPVGTVHSVATRPRGTGMTLEDYAASALAEAPAANFTMVAHSLGAIVGLAAASLAPGRVNGLVAVAGVIPDPSGSFLTAMPLPKRWILSVGIRTVGTRPPDKAIRKSLGAGLPPSIAGRLVEDFQPDSPNLFRSRIGRTDQPCRRGYVVTGNDPELPAKLQRRFVKALNPQWSTTLNTGHLPMLQEPGGLAAAIVDFTQTKSPGTDASE